jgi:hypothetical protein
LYTVDERDDVSFLEGIPPSSAGAPLPLVVATELGLAVAYLAEHAEPWDGTWPRAVGVDSPEETVAILAFRHPYAHQLGPPNDEAFAGHPLASRGLRPYGAFEVKRSSWVRALERMNRVHSNHRPEAYLELRHFALTFHDSTFECVARGVSVAEVFRGSVAAALPRMAKLLGVAGDSE